MGDPTCPLCKCQDSLQINRDSTRPYLQCGACSLVFVPPLFRLDPAAEKARYDLHQNDPEDSRYRSFLAPLADAIVRNTTAGSQGLDFGCGPGPVLSRMLHQNGRPTSLYDPFYAPDEKVWSRSYDFISSSETFEHLYEPRIEIDRLFRVLRPGGLLAVMTGVAPPLDRFGDWYYINDPTHVCFYSCETFAFIAERWGAVVRFEENNIALLRYGGNEVNAAKA